MPRLAISLFPAHPNANQGLDLSQSDRYPTPNKKQFNSSCIHIPCKCSSSKEAVAVYLQNCKKIQIGEDGKTRPVTLAITTVSGRSAMIPFLHGAKSVFKKIGTSLSRKPQNEDELISTCWQLSFKLL